MSPDTMCIYALLRRQALGGLLMIEFMLDRAAKTWNADHGLGAEIVVREGVVNTWS